MSLNVRLKEHYTSDRYRIMAGTEWHFEAIIEKEGSRWLVTDDIINGICEGKSVKFKTKREAKQYLENLGYHQ